MPPVDGSLLPAREELEARLLPLVRRALRNRTGLPALVRWVDRNLAALGGGPSPDPDRVASGLARMLSDLLLRQTGSRDRTAAETVAGP